jgi:putative Mn2+ efflux pump MntP
VVWLIAAVIGLIILLMAFQLVPLLAGFGLIVLALLGSVMIGERLDRSRQRSHHDAAAHFDVNRGELVGHASERSWDTPQPYIDHPDGGGTPPGMKDP